MKMNISERWKLLINGVEIQGMADADSFKVVYAPAPEYCHICGEKIPHQDILTGCTAFHGKYACCISPTCKKEFKDLLATELARHAAEFVERKRKRGVL